MLENLLKTWQIIAPDEITMPSPGVYDLGKTVDWDIYADCETLCIEFKDDSRFQDTLQGYIQRCLKARGWAYKVGFDNNSSDFYAFVHAIPYSITADSIHQSLLTAYLTALAAQRTITHGKWQHFKGDVVDVVNYGPWEGLGITGGVLLHAEATSFDLEESPDVKVFLHEYDDGSCDYSPFVEGQFERDYGDRVFYFHDGNRWARKTEDFLGLVGPEHPDSEGLLRFVEVAK